MAQIRSMAGYWRQSTGCHQTADPAYILISPDNVRDNTRWVFVHNNGKGWEPASLVQNGNIEVKENTTNVIVQYWRKQGEEEEREWTVGKYDKNHFIEWEWEDNGKRKPISVFSKVSE